MKSKTKIEEQLRKKTNSELVETIILAKKSPEWKEVAGALSGPRKKRKDINLASLSNSNLDSVVVCGKILGDGEVNKKMKVVALGFSKKAKEKLMKAGCEVKTIIEEIRSNKNAKGVTIIK
jgi:large subunit ribosomal protein L18e